MVVPTFQTVFQAMIRLFGSKVNKTTARSREDSAMAIAALRIGGKVVARSMNDGALGNRLREAATRVAPRARRMGCASESWKLTRELIDRAHDYAVRFHEVVGTLEGVTPP